MYSKTPRNNKVQQDYNKESELNNEPQQLGGYQ
jgi:hypothetical protein